MRRRELLRLALMVLAARLPGPAWGRDAAASARGSAGGGRRVVVIGAGMSGLAAARTLHRAGWEVIVLEGRSRLGGRTWTDHALGLPMDMGASWIEGNEGNPLTALAAELGVRTVPTGDDTLLFDHDGRRLDDEEADHVDEELATLMAAVEEMDADARLSIGAAIDRALGDDELSPFERRALAWGRASLETDTAADLDEMSLAGADEDDGFDGGSVVFPGGYGQLAEGLARGVDVRLGQPVEAIAWDGPGVRVTTREGAAFRADRVVVSLPLGVLQSGGVRFQPALPPAKARAIGRLGMGVLDKAILRFPRAFWPPDDFFGYLSRTPGEWPEWYNLGKALGQPILLGFCAGRQARAMERRDDDALRARVLEILRAMFGSRIPQPSGVVFTRWAADPFSLGSYSFIPLGSSPADRRELARPLAGRLHFAGEATSERYPATVHGAYLSGLRAAREITDPG